MFGPRINGPRITLAPPLPHYVDDYLRWLGDPGVTRYMQLRNPPSREQEEEFLRHQAASESSVFWAILLGDRHIGSTGIERIDWRNRYGHTGIVIGEKDCWAQGYATEVMRLRTRYAFDELGLETLTTEVYAPNGASRAALMRSGYREVGWLHRHVYLEGAFHDVWLGEILREDWRAGEGLA